MVVPVYSSGVTIPFTVETPDMATRKTRTRTIEEFKSRHGDRYDYSLVEYVNSHTKILIICPEHGQFSQQPRAHFAGQGCPKCTQSPNWIYGRRTTDSFIDRAREVHGDTYDYSLVVYDKVMARVTIVCKQHGPFTQLANSHLNGRGCPTCASNIAKTTDQFIIDAKTAHGDKYDYSLTAYNNATTPVTIICRTHGQFQQSPVSHTTLKNGCPRCGLLSTSQELRLTQDEFLARAQSVHGGNYDYNNTTYVDRYTPVTITCPKHGEFVQRPGDHINGRHGCPHCAGNIRKTTEQFVAEADARWSGRYRYANCDYANSKSPVTVTCLRHGDFDVGAGYHLADGGCPSCALSAGQHDLLQLVKNIVPREEVRSNDRRAIKPFELDVYVPGRDVAFEFHGDWYHSFGRPETAAERRRHLHKAELCELAGIKLLQIFEYEWKRRRPLIESMVAHRLGSSHKLHARKLRLAQPDTREYREFMVTNHLHGYAHSDATYALYRGDEPVSMMGFRRGAGWAVSRYATVAGFAVAGGGGRLFAAFLREHRPESVFTYADRRFSTGEVYKQLGFGYLGATGPNYRYLADNMRPVSRIACQKHKLPRLLGERFDPTRSEAANMFHAGYRRLWDAGSHRLSWRPPDG